MTTPNIPTINQLDRDEAASWLISIMAGATALNARVFLTTDPGPPKDPAQFKHYMDKRDLLLSALIEIIPKDIHALIIPKTGRPTPHSVTEAVKNHPDSTRPEYHEQLKPIADTIVLRLDMPINEYQRQHEALHAHMRTAHSTRT